MSTLVDFDDAAKRLSISPYSLRAWARRGLIKTVKVGRRRLIPASECDRISQDGLQTTRQFHTKEGVRHFDYQGREPAVNESRSVAEEAAGGIGAVHNGSEGEAHA